MYRDDHECNRHQTGHPYSHAETEDVVVVVAGVAGVAVAAVVALEVVAVVTAAVVQSTSIHQSRHGQSTGRPHVPGRKILEDVSVIAAAAAAAAAAALVYSNGTTTAKSTSRESHSPVNPGRKKKANHPFHFDNGVGHLN